jgi:hypothetical protein
LEVLARLEDQIFRTEGMLGSNSSTEKLHVFTVVDPKDNGYLPARKRRIKPLCESIAVPK